MISDYKQPLNPDASAQPRGVMPFTVDNKADITTYVVDGEAVSFYQAAVGLKAKGDIKRLPASYFIEIPFTNVDETIRMGQRIKNHFMDAIIEKLPKPKK